MDKIALLAIAGWVAVGLGFIAQAAPMKWPDIKWIPSAFFGLGIFIVAAALALGMGLGWDNKQGWLFFLPSGATLGFASAGIVREWLSKHLLDDSAWRNRPKLELYEIACRAVGAKPVLPIPTGAPLSMLRLLADAIQSRDLRAIGIEGSPSANIDHMTQVPHASLTEFARASGNDALSRFATDWKPLANADSQKLLYLGDIHVDARELERDKIVFTVRCFNGGPGLASIQYLKGCMEYRGQDQPPVQLSTITLMDGGKVEAAWGEELFFSLETIVPSSIASEIAQRLDSNESVEFGFQDLVIGCHLGPPVRHTVKLPLWNGIQCAKVGGRVCVIGWIIGAAINITV